ncbi:dTMP kinase [bacterium]|nr:dTMP kinase [bacterium]
MITFEGIDGSGKSTQAEKALEFLKERGVQCKLLREPGGTPLGEAIRKILLAPVDSGITMNRYAEYLLFAASRAELCRWVIKPLLKQGFTVLVDRFGDSSLAYQGYGHGVDLDFIRRTNEVATDGLKPDLSILFDIDVETAFARLEDANDRIENEGINFFKRVREGFLKIAEQESETYIVVNAALEIEAVEEDVIRAISGRM